LISLHIYIYKEKPTTPLDTEKERKKHPRLPLVSSHIDRPFFFTYLTHPSFRSSPTSFLYVHPSIHIYCRPAGFSDLYSSSFFSLANSRLQQTTQHGGWIILQVM
ncbi:hypothetical protein LINGRAHAP2_LOCUS877, partial [Linum grandiflorum]